MKDTSDIKKKDSQEERSKESMWDKISRELDRPDLAAEIGEYMKDMTAKQRYAFVQNMENDPEFLIEYESAARVKETEEDPMSLEEFLEWAEKRWRNKCQEWKARIAFWKKSP